MKTKVLLSVVALACFLSARPAACVVPKSTELAKVKAWADGAFGDSTAGRGIDMFASFTYDGKPSAELLASWKLDRASRKLDDKRTEHTLTYADPKTGLVLRCVGVEYSDFPDGRMDALFQEHRNGRHADHSGHSGDRRRFRSPCRQRVHAALHKGDTCAIDSFQPLVETLGPKAVKKMAPGGGRPTNGANPFWKS